MGIDDTVIGVYKISIYSGDRQGELLKYAYDCVSCGIDKASHCIYCPGVKPNVGVCDACLKKYDLDSDDLDKRKKGLALMKMKYDV